MIDIPGLITDNTSRIEAKIENFRRAGVDQLQVVFDFDRTLTVAKADTGEVTTWHILHEHLPAAAKAHFHKQLAHYRPLELNGTITKEEAATWTEDTLSLFVKYQVDLGEVERDFLSRASIRAGAKELFDLCARHEIPTIILSAGIKDVIEIWARAYGIKPTIILSTALQTDAGNRISGWDRTSLVHFLNKHEIGHPELTQLRKERSHALLIGDSLKDADMAKGTDAVLRVRIHDPRPDETASKENVRSQTFKLFDAIVESGSMQPIEELLRTIIEV